MNEQTEFALRLVQDKKPLTKTEIQKGLDLGIIRRIDWNDYNGRKN